MFKRSISALAAMAALLSSAGAADFVTKAKPFANVFAATPCTVASCSGFYVGVGIADQGSNADIVGNGLAGSVFAGGMVPSVNVGYQYMQGPWMFGAELNVGYALATKVRVGAAGGSLDGVRFTQFFKAGGDLAGVFGGQSHIIVPAALASSVLSPYVGMGTTQWQLPGAWANGVVSGAGVLFNISPRLFGDLRYTYTNFDSAKAGNSTTIQNDQAVRISVNYKLN